LDNLIRKQARLRDKSLNKTIKEILEQSLGIRQQEGVDNRNDFTDLFGTWNQEDKSEFEAITSDLNKIHDDDWQ